MKISVLLRTAMADKEIKSAIELSDLSEVSYSTVTRALDDKNVGIRAVVTMLNCMGYQLKAEVK